MWRHPLPTTIPVSATEWIWAGSNDANSGILLLKTADNILTRSTAVAVITQSYWTLTVWYRGFNPRVDSTATLLWYSHIFADKCALPLYVIIHTDHGHDVIIYLVTWDNVLLMYNHVITNHTKEDWVGLITLECVLFCFLFCSRFVLQYVLFVFCFKMEYFICNIIFNCNF